jgi:thiamine pyrophosphate-dependent acetolactate synthase large subunit-like protein
MPSRTEIVRAVLDTAARRDMPVFIGNGFLAREVMAQAGAPGASAVLPLHGGMGLAGGVAAGYLLARACPGAIVLEGDGNHLMGWGCAQLIGHLGLHVIHVVACNGIYQSTGGQPIPGQPQPDRVRAASTALGYACGIQARTSRELGSALSHASNCGPVLLYVTQDDRSGVPTRAGYCTADYADALSEALCTSGTAREAGR